MKIIFEIVGRIVIYGLGLVVIVIYATATYNIYKREFSLWADKVDERIKKIEELFNP